MGHGKVSKYEVEMKEEDVLEDECEEFLEDEGEEHECGGGSEG